jgi:hypothetical protein
MRPCKSPRHCGLDPQSPEGKRVIISSNKGFQPLVLSGGKPQSPKEKQKKLKKTFGILE